MNRFRRKSDARKRKEAAGNKVETSSTPTTEQQRTPVLPQVNDFRTSLILPHLTRRFTLLRAEDGSLVDFSTMQSHLAAQRETGRLTAFEVDAVLAQYQLQSLSETPHPPSHSAPAWSQDFRQRDWSSPPYDDASGSRSASSLSHSTSDLERDPPYTASSFGGTSSSVPFPYTIDPPSPSASTVTSTPTIANFRRGGNSMFGGRVQSVAQLKMSKSASSVSLRSNGSPRTRRSPSVRQDDDDDDEGTGDRGDLTESTGTLEETEDYGDRMDALEDQDVRGDGEEGGQLALPQLSDRQLNRISRVLDDIELELSKTYSCLADDGQQEEDEQEELTGTTSSSGPLSPTTSSAAGHDTEPIDPFFHHLAPSNSSQVAEVVLPPVSSPLQAGPSLRSLAKSDSAATLPSPAPPPDHTRPSPKRTSTTYSLAGSDRRVLSPTPIPSVSSREDYSLARQTSSSSKSSAPSVNSVEHKAADDVSEVEDSPEMPGAFSPSRIPARWGTVDDGPFDLGPSASARGSVVARPESKAEHSGKGYAASSSASTGPSTLFSPGGNVSSSSLGSTGSSYHAEVAGSDDENYQLDLLPTLEESLRPSSNSEQVPHGSTASSDDDFLRAASAASRRPSDELIKDLQPASDGSDIVLEDLLVIQDTLVRSASRRAERKAGAVAPSSLAESGVERSRSLSESTNESVEDEALVSSRPPSTSLAANVESPMTEEDLSSSEATPSSLQEPFYTPSIAQSDAFEYRGLTSSSKTSDLWDQDQDAEPDLELQHLDDPFARDTSRDPLPLTSSLGDPVELDANPPRVPRSMPLRNPASTQSLLIRDVRNQATMATMALKKQHPASAKPPGRTKSIRKIKNQISSPQFVSGPSGILSVPIINPSLVPSSPSPSTSHGRDASRDDRPKKNGIGLRFKMLLKKQSRDRLPHLNGDEVTPFVDFDSASPETTPPFTPPSQSTSQFAASPSDFPITPKSPDVPNRSPASTRTNFSRSPGPSFDHRSEGSHTTNGSHNLTRVASHPGRSRHSDVSPQPTDEDDCTPTSGPSSSRASVASTSSRPTTQLQQPAHQRWQSTEQKEAAIGLGLALSSRAAISYDIGSMRRRREADYGQVPQTAPLDVQRHGQSDSLQLQQSNSDFSQPPRSAPLPGGRSRHEGKASIDSMRKLWDAAEDLGLSPEKAQELVDLSYNRDPSSASNSLPSHPRSRPSEEQEDATTRDNSSMTPSTSAHSRKTSTASSHASRARANSSNIRRSVADRVPTPPPGSSHRRKASHELRVAAGPVPEVPDGLLAVETGGEGGRQSMLSVSGGGSPSLRLPLSPSQCSIQSFRSSGYGGSIYDYYAEEHEGSMRSSYVEGEQTVGGDESRREEQDDQIWKVVDDLRKNRDSGISDTFNSHRSSYDSNGLPFPSPGLDPNPNSFDFQLRHKGRTRVAVPSARYPSIYVRDEKRLAALADEGGVAHEEEGNFLVRIKGEEERGRRVGEEERGRTFGEI